MFYMSIGSVLVKKESVVKIMQISQSNNQTSFGIRSIKFDSKDAKAAFQAATKKIPSEKMSQVLEEIRALKPKKGPDIDTFITSVNGVYSFSKKNPFEGKTQYMDRPFKWWFTDKSEITPKTMLRAFKNLVKSVDEDRVKTYVDVSDIPNNLLNKVSNKVK